MFAWLIAQNFVMMARPLLRLISELTSATHLGMALLTHLSVSSATGIVIAFTYFELDIIKRGSLKRDISIIMVHKEQIMLTGGIIQLILFLVGPFLGHYLEVSASLLFWIPMIFVCLLIIPCFCYLGCRIYAEIQAMMTVKYQELARHIIASVCVCTFLGLAAGALAITSLIVPEIEWIVVEICWLVDNVFNLLIFIIFSRKPIHTPDNNNGSENSSPHAVNTQQTDSRKTASKSHRVETGRRESNQVSNRGI